MQAHASPPRWPRRGLPTTGSARAASRVHTGRIPQWSTGSSGGWDTCPSYSVSPQVTPGSTVEVRRGDGTLGTLRDPYASGDAEPASERDSFYGTFGSVGCWAPPCQGQEDFGGLLSLSWADQIDPSQSLNGAPGCGCGDRSGREVAVRAHTSAVVVCPRGGPGPWVPSQRPCWSAQARYHGGP